MGLFSGLGFGSSKTKTATKSNTRETQNTTQQQSAQQVQQGTTATRGTTTQTGTTSQTRDLTSITGQDTRQNVLGRTETQQFSDADLNVLSGLLRNASAGADSELSRLLAQSASGLLTGFDPAKFVADTVAGVAQQARTQGAQAIGELSSRIGGTPGTNSAASLLASRINADVASAIANARATATGQANQILQGNLAAAQSVALTPAQQANLIAEQLRGGRIINEQQQTTAGGATTTTRETGGTTQRQATQQSSEQISTQLLLNALTQLLTSNELSTQAVDATSKSKKTDFAKIF